MADSEFYEVDNDELCASEWDKRFDRDEPEPIVATVIPDVVLDNREMAPYTPNPAWDYPRLMVNDKGEVVLAISRSDSGLTTGILVGRVKGSKISNRLNDTIELGKKYTDWEVGGELKDYDGELVINLKNKLR